MAMIYALKNRENGFAYIGCTSGNLAKRMREHRCLLRKGAHKVTLLQQHWKEMPESTFIIECLERFDSESNVVMKRARELYWMQQFSMQGKLYNEHQVSFQPTPQAHKKAIEASAKSNFRKTEKFLEGRKAVMQKTLLTEENKAGNRARMNERWKDPAFREKMREAMDRGRRNRKDK